MRKPVRSSGQIVLVFIFLWVILFGGASSARAQRIIYRESIPTGQTIEGDVVLIGTDVVVDGTVNGDVLAIGMTITINGDIQGSLLSAGVSEIIAGEIGGSLYSGALTLELESQARVARSVYFAGLSLITQAGSQIR